MFSLIILLPLFSSICTGFFGFALGVKGAVIITSTSLFIAAFLSIFCLYKIGFLLKPMYINLISWIDSGLFSVDWLLYIDNLTILMFLLVTIVSLMVYIYSSSYMLEDPHLIRFSCYISLFTFFMLVLVTSYNLVQLFFGWEGVGICSYLLINFWYTRIQANKAAIKALVVNKIGDLCFMLGIAAIFVVYQAVDFGTIFLLTPYLGHYSFVLFSKSFNVISIICLLLFLGAVGKSAQLGLHTWLPDAMEGPTPVSALIHAATMVTAGVFLIIRCSPLFEYSEDILLFITLIGALTAFFAATVGMLQNDLKRVIAYSTCSQLGYMIFACGLSNYHVAFFHLFNHGFFKALLFLSAGSIIHGLSDEQDLRKMGGLLRIFPVTYSMFLIGSLALMGFPFLTGFYSKDVILEIAFSKYTVISIFVYWLGTISAFFTAFYSFRLIYLTFITRVNSYKIVVNRAHESNFLILIPLIILCLGSIFIGYLTKDLIVGVGSNFFGSSIFFLPRNYNLIEAEFLPLKIKLLPLFFSLSGVYFSLFFNNFYKNYLIDLKLSSFGRKLFCFFNQKWYFDKIFNIYLIYPLFSCSYFVTFKLIDKGFIELFGPSGVTLLLNSLSKKVSSIQSGLIYQYTFVLLIGIFIYFNLTFFIYFIEVIFNIKLIIYYLFLILFLFSLS